jgi:GT2 family glycosyltransferase
VKILAVMVRYQAPLEESSTLRGIRSEIRTDLDLACSYDVMIWDNSQQELEPAQLPPGVLYRHSATNLGVSGAYNAASRYARENGYCWMLLLDQDTELRPGFLRSMLRHGHDLEGQVEIAAIVPTVFVRGQVVSPRRQLFNRHRAYPLHESGIAPGESFAINSGCLLRVTALHEIGGFSSDFWLDYSDLYVFHQFYLHGKKVWRAADVQLEHDMSIMDYDRLMTAKRYRNFSLAESAFNDIYKGQMENAVQTARLFFRAIKQRRKYRNPEFAQIAWQQLLYRLRVPRTERIAQWLAASRSRSDNQAAACGDPREALPL